MPVTGAFPYELNNVLGGAARVLWAPIGASVPTGPKDIFSQVFPYNPQGGAYIAADADQRRDDAHRQRRVDAAVGRDDLHRRRRTGATITVSQTSRTTNTLTVTATSAAITAGAFIYTATAWHDFGATRDAFSYNRDISVGQFNIQQTQAAILEEVTEFTRTAQVSLAELSPENLAIMEEGVKGLNVTAASGTSAFEGVQYGTIEALTQRRCAFVARKNPALGVVTEPGGRTRGRFVVGLGYRSQLSADNVQVGFARGELAAAQVTFKFYPETAGSLTSGTEYGVHWIERAGTIA
jgi:hypothetical protein